MFFRAFVSTAVAVSAAAVVSAQQPGQQTQPQQAQQARHQDQQQTMAQRRLESLQPSREVAGDRRARIVLVTSPGRIAGNASAFYGVPVSIHAAIGEIRSPHVFTLDQDAWWRFDDELPVLLPRPSGTSTASAGEYVTVVGTVRPFVRAEMEREYDWFDFDNLADVNIELEGRPVIVADMARTSDGEMLATPQQEMTNILIASPGEIAETPSRFYGEIVATRQEIEDVWSARAFTLDEDNWFAGPDVLVLNPSPMGLQLEAFDDYEGDTALVYGIVRPFVSAEFEQDYAWFNATDYAEFELAQLEQRPVIVASSIITEEGLDLVISGPEFALDRAQETYDDRRATQETRR